jgi:hypothetical protein
MSEDATVRDRAYEQRIDQARRFILDALAEAREGFVRAIQPEGSNAFTWQGESFWVDRKRSVVLPMLTVAAWRELATLPDDGELGEAFNLIECFAGSARMVSTGDILKCFVQVLRGQVDGWDGACAHLLNLAVAQPLINPAFESLFWLALADDSGPAGHRENLYELVAPMTHETKDFPDVRLARADVRLAQVSFLQRMVADADLGGARALSDEAWAARCADELARRHVLVEQHVFHEVLLRAGPDLTTPA